MPTYSHLNNWPPFEGHSMGSIERDDGMRYVLPIDSNERGLPLTPKHLDRMRIVYRTFDDVALFLGMNVPTSDKHRALGEKMIQYFIESVDQLEGTFDGTGIIRKPIIALQLNRVGLEPESSHFMAEILPRSKYEVNENPKIHVLCNTLPPEDTVSRSDTGSFYEIVPPDQVAASYPLGTDDKIIALHTRYDLPRSS